jgi:hypothetical protein
MTLQKWPRNTDGMGMIPQLGAISLTEDERFTQITANALLTAIDNIISAVNGKLSFGSGAQGYQAGNLDAHWLEHYFTLANTEEVIPHRLGRLPIGYITTRRSKACIIYDSNPGSWDESIIRLKCDTAASSVLLLLF